MIIGVEGCDGVGKTTFISSILRLYPDTFTTISDYSIDSHDDAVSDKFVDVKNDAVKFFLYLAMAANQHHLYKQLLRDDNRNLLLDRSIYTHFAYSTSVVSIYDRRLLAIREILMSSVPLITIPDVIVYIYLDAEEIESRLNNRDRRVGSYEKNANIEFWTYVDIQYRYWFNKIPPERIIFIDGKKSRDEIVNFFIEELK